MHKILFYIKFIIFLYMFRAPCVHHQEVKIVLYSIWYRHTCRMAVRCAGRVRSVQGTATYTMWRYQMPYNTILTSWWWAQQCSKHVEAYNKSYYKTRICALSWLITNIILRCTVSKTKFNLLLVHTWFFPYPSCSNMLAILMEVSSGLVYS
jgi:hypothetical protein